MISNDVYVKFDAAIRKAMQSLEASGTEVTPKSVSTEIAADFSAEDQMDLALSGWTTTQLADVRQHLDDTLQVGRLADPKLAEMMERTMQLIDDAIGVDEPED